ncbi:MAG: helicase/relaxase domain-containing protein [Acidobacteria bacterium]|nr:helicase/relaxase domain-containing protein [Acidobacteriota bacterium]
MFDNIFKRFKGDNQDNKPRGPSLAPAGATEVQPGGVLLAPRMGEVDRLASLAAVPDPHFAALYMAALESLAGFAQNLPLAGNPSVSILDAALQRAVGALSRRRGYLLPKGAASEIIAKKGDLWTYAVFTTALLPALHEVLKHRVWLYDSAALEIGLWQPWRGSMVECAGWYSVESTGEAEEEPLPPYVVPMLANLVLPEEGLAWLWTDREVIRHWLGAIAHDRKIADVLLEIIAAPKSSHASEPAIRLVRENTENTVHDAKDLTATTLAQPRDLPGAKPKRKKKPSARDDRFLVWLKAGIAEGTLPVNKPGSEVHIVPEGLFLAAPDIFKSFAGVKWNDAFKTFLKLRLHLINENDNSPYFFYQLGGPSPTKGVLISDPTLVFEEGKLPTAHGARIHSLR